MYLKNYKAWMADAESLLSRVEVRCSTNTNLIFGDCSLNSCLIAIWNKGPYLRPFSHFSNIIYFSGSGCYFEQFRNKRRAHLRFHCQIQRLTLLCISNSAWRGLEKGCVIKLILRGKLFLLLFVEKHDTGSQFYLYNIYTN